MTSPRGDVSLVWLTTESGMAPLPEAWSAVRQCSNWCGEAILVGHTPVLTALDSQPAAFPRQHVIACDPGESPGAALNRAAGSARGLYLLIVAGAVSADAGWLEPLVPLLETDPSVGVATPQLIGADGRLVAAGSVAWADGTCEAFGAGAAPGSPECAFRREVPALPPHVVMVRSSALEAAGGFDIRYLTPEYVVADLCFSFRSRGVKALYHPRAAARVSTTAATSGVQVADRLRFGTRWSGELAAFPQRPADAVTPRQWLSARDALASERMLVVDDRVHGPDRGSGDPRMFAMLHELLALWPTLRVTLAAMTSLDAERNAPRLQDRGIEVTYSEHWSSWFQHRLGHYGIVLMSRPQAAVVDDWIRGTQPQAFRIYDAEALVYRRLQRMLSLTDGAERPALRDQIRAARAIELDYLAAADEIFCVSREEQRVARAVAAESAPVIVLPFCVDIVESPPGFSERSDLVYFGGFMAGPGSPNEDAVLHLAHDVLPLIRQRVPDVVLYVVGADPTPAVLALESEQIHVVGYVQDPRSWLDRVRVHLVPMRFGAGVKQKLIDTMAAGLPFVTTPVGAEGLRLGGLSRFTVAESPPDLADLAVSLYFDADRWTSAQQQILRLARRHDRQEFRRVLATAFSQAGLEPPQHATMGALVTDSAR